MGNKDVQLMWAIGQLFVLLFMLGVGFLLTFLDRQKRHRLLASREHGYHEFDEFVGAKGSMKTNLMDVVHEVDPTRERDDADASADVHRGVIYVLATAGFYWNKLPWFPRKTVFYLRSWFAILCFCVYLVDIYFYLSAVWDGQSFLFATLSGIGLIIYYVGLTLSWKQFNVIGALLHTPFPVRRVSNGRRMWRHVTIYLWMQCVFGGIFPALVSSIYLAFGIGQFLRWYLIAFLAIFAFLGEYITALIRLLIVDVFDIAIGKKTDSSMRESLDRYHSLEALTHHISATLSCTAIPMGIILIMEVMLSILYGLLWHSRVYFVVASLSVMIMSAVSLFPISNANAEIARLRHLLSHVRGKFLMEDDLIMFSPDEVRARMKLDPTHHREEDPLIENGTAHVLHAMTTLRGDTIRDDDTVQSQSHPTTKGKSGSVKMQASMTEDDMAQLDVIHRHDVVMQPGIRVFGTIITHQFVWSSLGVILAYAAFIVQYFLFSQEKMEY
eukprot:TRINITY_DN624_c0_g2_i1.p1 TRINITY_DN624_c0_g2~~TRINITY_DN624_c0_g2_i1.p1  ORF type:complete len:498 (+),score=95.63 TRINITY_DN624_c0_g2_i1:97-1590(+)